MAMRYLFVFKSGNEIVGEIDDEDLGKLDDAFHVSVVTGKSVVFSSGLGLSVNLLEVAGYAPDYSDPLPDET